MEEYAVIWREPAETSVLAALLRAADKPGTWAVVRDIDARLRADPHTEGESRDPGDRLMFCRPFAVLYRIDDAARTVYIERVKWVGQ